jgi:hypothetical protein
MKTWIVKTIDHCEPYECVDCDRITRRANDCNGLSLLNAIEASFILSALKEAEGIIANESKLTEIACKGLDQIRAAISKYEAHK